MNLEVESEVECVGTTNLPCCEAFFSCDSSDSEANWPLWTHLSYSSHPHHGTLRGKQLGQTAHIDRQHDNGERVADLVRAAQLDLADGCAMLLGVSNQCLDHFANDLADLVAWVPRSAFINRTFVAYPCAGLGREFIDGACLVTPAASLGCNCAACIVRRQRESSDFSNPRTSPTLELLQNRVHGDDEQQGTEE